jgi:hypothetical protein
MSQFWYGMVHMRTAHAPFVHSGDPFATRHVLPHIPQAAMLLCVSMHALSQHDCPIGQGRMALQPVTQVDPRHVVPGGQWSLVTHCTHARVRGSQRLRVTPPSPVAMAQASSRLQPMSHAPVAVLQYCAAVQTVGIVAQLTHAPEAMSQMGRPGMPAQLALEVHRGGPMSTGTSTGAVMSGATSTGTSFGGTWGLLLLQPIAKASSASAATGPRRAAFLALSSTLHLLIRNEPKANERRDGVVL